MDEGHTIRNPKTKMAKAVCALPAERRWVLTGTPIVRHYAHYACSADDVYFRSTRPGFVAFSFDVLVKHNTDVQDLGSILTFLQICKPLDSEEFFKRLLLRPLKDGLPSGFELLRVSLDMKSPSPKTNLPPGINESGLHSQDERG